MQILPSLKPPRFTALCVSAAVFLTACNSVASVSVHKSEPVIQRHEYDKDNRLPQEVGKHPSVEANTHWDFRIVPEVTVERRKLVPNAQGVSASVVVKNINVEVSLPIDMWVPEGVSERVIAHEDGHISICRHFYKDADTVARECANSAVGHTFEGTGRNENEATQRAIESVSSELIACYQRKIIEPANRASAAYDRLTRHGQNATPIDIAIEKAIQEAQAN